MDLAQVKTAVKVWEKAFKAKYKREPTKEDIKKDPSGIAEQYALYRKLSKPSTSGRLASSSQAPSSSASTQVSVSGTAGTGSQRTPRNIPTSDYPTTPTPPPRRPYVQREISKDTGPSAEAGPSRHAPTQESQSSNTGEGRTLKRTASKANLSPPAAHPSTSLGSFLTPRKPRPDAPGDFLPAYAGPVLDPNPLNPFLASPSRSRISPFAHQPQPSEIKSPFIHASSPRKFKEVLEANSLRKVRARLDVTASPSKEVTPRTKARKRLRGEIVDDTPGKPVGGPRRKRGQRENMEMESQIESMEVDLEDMTEEEEDSEDDGLGPTPMKDTGSGFLSFSAFPDELPKPAAGKGIAEKLAAASKNGQGKQTVNGTGKGKGKAVDERQLKMNTFFNAAPRPKAPKPAPVAPKSVVTSKTPANGNGHIIKPSSTLSGPSRTTNASSSRYPISTRSLSPPIPSSDAQTSDLTLQAGPQSDPVERLPTPPPNPEVEEAALLVDTPSKVSRGVHRRTVQRVLPPTNKGDMGDEEDGMEGQSGEENEIVIVPTRREVDAKYLRRRGSMSSLGSGPDGSVDQAEEGKDEEEQEQGDEDFGSDDEDGLNDPNLPPHLLSLLSLRSPTKPLPSRNKTDLVYKALFDPEAAVRLKARQRGQDVMIAGVEVGREDEEEGDEEEALLDRLEEGQEDIIGKGSAYEDDDWEEEDEGWKRPGEDMEDEW